MQKGIIGKKIGMTQVFDENGKVVPVTVVEAGPCKMCIRDRCMQRRGTGEWAEASRRLGRGGHRRRFLSGHRLYGRRLSVGKAGGAVYKRQVIPPPSSPRIILSAFIGIFPFVNIRSFSRFMPPVRISVGQMQMNFDAFAVQPGFFVKRSLRKNSFSPV